MFEVLKVSFYFIFLLINILMAQEKLHSIYHKQGMNITWFALWMYCSFVLFLIKFYF